MLGVSSVNVDRRDTAALYDGVQNVQDVVPCRHWRHASLRKRRGVGRFPSTCAIRRNEIVPERLRDLPVVTPSGAHIRWER
jgi:hypothetical protein